VCRRPGRLLLVTAGVVSLALLSAPAVGQGRRYGKAFIERFSLSGEQVAKLDGIRSFRVNSREEERVIRHKINLIVHSDAYDETKLAQLADALTSLLRSNLLAEAALVHEFYVSLNEEQRQLWAEHETRRTRDRKGPQKDPENRAPPTQRPGQQP
jgi:Spy/CpxP family protein refolding chaperone